MRRRRWQAGVRGWPRSVLRRLRAHAPSLLLAATAAGVAYAVAAVVFGSQNAVFAPVAAVVATGLSAGQRVTRAAEISTGVVLGVLAADLLTRWVGVGPLQLAVAVLVAMSAAVAVRPSGLMANQSAVAAVVAMVLVPYLDTGPWVRLGDAVVGGLTAVALNAVASPDPYRSARTVTDDVLNRLAAMLDAVARALEAGSLDDADAAMDEVAALDDAHDEITGVIAATRERLAWRPADRRRGRDVVEAVEAVANRVPVMLATGRGLCRASGNLVRHAGRDAVPAGLVDAVDELVTAVRELACWVAGEGDVVTARDRALRAAALASAVPPGAQPRWVLVGQVRAMTVDLLRASGLVQRDAVAAVEEAAGRADRLGGPGATGGPGTSGPVG
ncbi:FUSC family protein [Thalassiella azotivora]